jgi:hypothetical protein
MVASMENRLNMMISAQANFRQPGFQILRFWNNEVLQDIEAVKDRIWIVVQERVLQKQSEGQMWQQTHPHPNPPLEGEGK